MYHPAEQSGQHAWRGIAAGSSRWHNQRTLRWGEHGQIAVKVIGDRGNELTVVKDLKE